MKHTIVAYVAFNTLTKKALWFTSRMAFKHFLVKTFEHALAGDNIMTSVQNSCVRLENGGLKHQGYYNMKGVVFRPLRRFPELPWIGLCQVDQESRRDVLKRVEQLDFEHSCRSDRVKPVWIADALRGTVVHYPSIKEATDDNNFSRVCITESLTAGKSFYKNRYIAKETEEDARNWLANAAHEKSRHRRLDRIHVLCSAGGQLKLESTFTRAVDVVKTYDLSDHTFRVLLSRTHSTSQNFIKMPRHADKCFKVFFDDSPEDHKTAFLEQYAP